MTRESALPAPVRRGLDALLDATEALIDAADSTKAEKIDRALRRRAESIDRLRPSLACMRVAPGSPAQRELRETEARIASRAAEAARRLDGMRRHARDELIRLVRGGTAARSYRPAGSGARVLDRSG